MHRRILTLSALPLLAGLMAAEPAEKAEPGHGPDPAKMAEHFNKMKDKNPEFFKKVDADGDGTVTAAEVKAFHEKEQARRKEQLDKAFATADKDKDGKLSREEFTAALELARRAPPMDRGERKGPPEGKGPDRKGPPEGKGPDRKGPPPPPMDEDDEKK